MILELEVRNPMNGDLYFLPIGRRIRGHLDFARVNMTESTVMVRQYPDGVPGQRLVLDTEAKTATIIEPMHEPAHLATRAKVEKTRGLPPDREIVPGIDVPTCLFWAKRAVESGLARLVRGAFPDKIEGKVRKRFMSPEEPDKLEEERQLRRQEVAARLATMTPQQRREFDRLLAGDAPE